MTPNLDFFVYQNRFSFFFLISTTEISTTTFLFQPFFSTALPSQGLEITVNLYFFFGLFLRILCFFLKILCTISCIIPTILQSYTDISNLYILAFNISQCELFSNERKRSVLPPVLTSACPWSWCWRQPQCIHCIVSVRVIARKLLKVHNKALCCINVCVQLE